MTFNCPTCGRFCGKVVAILNGLEEIKKVTGECSKCGDVDLTNCDWVYEDFVCGEASS